MQYKQFLFFLAALYPLVGAAPIPEADEAVDQRDVNIIIPVVGHSFVANEGGGYASDDDSTLPGLANAAYHKTVPVVGYSFVANEGYGDDEKTHKEVPVVGLSFVANEGYGKE
ncbi:hypothetical protein K491DRAFT_774364 [Lophiostoma macrostomum CBS 122681]|uniref:Uncharacterized protein n=1 Tax=Lophiostoma macrostomum CBS 122681 TaxID=1314788 RepID=A0A6A6TQ97_9PLEO|nr:hypothetical protein K491DRAFT_774364 [Lophiostoma macrostomum CBS 122681]